VSSLRRIIWKEEQGNVQNFNSADNTILCILFIMKAKFTAVLRREEDEYVALNPELDIASQGPTPELPLANLREAVGLFLECADTREIEERLSPETWITQFDADYAQA
jgi:predicted RNase H-like HicB family nuclease